MPTFDANTAQCEVFTFKDGLLARAAHDLRLRVTDFSLELDEAQTSVRATFVASSLEVVATISDGGVEEQLDDGDLNKIRAHIADDVLHAAEYPEIRFDSTRITPLGQGFTVEGDLTIKGKTRPHSIDVVEEGDHWVGETVIHQPHFGIAPFKALLGAIRIKPDVRVRISAPKLSAER